ESSLLVLQPAGKSLIDNTASLAADSAAAVGNGGALPEEEPRSDVGELDCGAPPALESDEPPPQAVHMRARNAPAEMAAVRVSTGRGVQRGRLWGSRPNDPSDEHTLREAPDGEHLRCS